MTVEHVAESVGGVQQDFFDHSILVRERDAAELRRGVEGEDHLLS